jgi:hypothetical protein
MGDDDAAIATYGLIRPCLFWMPMSVDERLYAVVPCAFLYSFQQCSRIGSKPAVDHQCAFFTVHGDHVAAGTLEDEEATKIHG